MRHDRIRDTGSRRIQELTTAALLSFYPARSFPGGFFGRVIDWTKRQLFFALVADITTAPNTAFKLVPAFVIEIMN